MDTVHYDVYPIFSAVIRRSVACFERWEALAIGFRVVTKTVAMEIEVHVDLRDLKRALHRLMTRLSDEAEAGTQCIILDAQENSLEIIAGETSEVLNVTVVHGGRATVPSTFFVGVARSLRFHHGGRIDLVLSAGELRINRTEYRHPSISVLDPDTEKAIRAAKPAKLQNL